jgi:quinol monooxygenase YgiN
MATLFVKHRVADFTKWKAVYDEVDGLRKQHGITAASIHRTPDDPNVVIVTHRFKDMKGAKALADSPGLKAAMERAGIQGAPEFWFGEDVEDIRYP